MINRVETGKLRSSFKSPITWWYPYIIYREQGYRTIKPNRHIFKTPEEIKVIQRCEKILRKEIQRYEHNK